ncbi:MAG: hypothetical protein PHO41_08435 [Eubacteriales bacterium]|nr:hypothetical protein [Eubacteriales bacterium]
MTAWSLRGRFALHMMFNAYWQDLEFELPYLSDVSFNGWHRWIDTSLVSPDDISSLIGAPPVIPNSYKLASRSVVVLAAGKNL